jgi:hypothetical protein
MKIKLTEDFCRSLARNILFNSNEKINLMEMNMSPEKTASYGSQVNPQAGNFKLPGFDRPGPMTSSRKERTKFESEDETDLESNSDLPIGNTMVNYEIEGIFDNKDENIKVVKKKGRK